jgi:hypothetical protein
MRTHTFSGTVCVVLVPHARVGPGEAGQGDTGMANTVRQYRQARVGPAALLGPHPLPLLRLPQGEYYCFCSYR